MPGLLGISDEGQGEEVARELGEEGIDARFLHLDVADQEMVDAAARYVDETFGHLDILVNNAGINIGSRKASEVGAEVMLTIYRTKVFGVVAMTQAMLPTLPGFGLSEKPTELGWTPERIARAWFELMRRLGYDRFVAQGGGQGRCQPHLRGLPTERITRAN